MITWFFKDKPIEECMKCYEASQLVKFSCGQVEICPTTKSEHLQTYVEFNDKVSMMQIKDLFDRTVKILERCGTQEQAIEYCTKLDTRKEGCVPFFYGKQKLVGHRSDLDSMVDMMEDGHTAKEILLRHRGNGLRHISFIVKGLNVLYDNEVIDRYILAGREAKTINNPYDEIVNELLIRDETIKKSQIERPEVAGNTSGHSGQLKIVTNDLKNIDWSKASVISMA